MERQLKIRNEQHVSSGVLQTHTDSQLKMKIGASPNNQECYRDNMRAGVTVTSN